MTLAMRRSAMVAGSRTAIVPLLRFGTGSTAAGGGSALLSSDCFTSERCEHEHVARMRLAALPASAASRRLQTQADHPRILIAPLRNFNGDRETGLFRPP
jgi:hypothetical protein